MMWPSIHILYALLGGSEFYFELEYNKQDSEHLHSIQPECKCSMQFQKYLTKIQKHTEIKWTYLEG